ncbi:MAG: alpha/beta hydrolase [Microbacteriaceae bacterium]|nr:MAG: alpha/beta hydrolase [Microbacteriaceae bacterium]
MIVSIVIAVLALGTLCVLYLHASAAKVVRARQADPIEVRWGDGQAILPASQLTCATGSYGMWVEGPQTTGHLLLGDIINHDGESQTVSRQVLERKRLPERGNATGRFTGQIYVGPDVIALGRYSEVAVPTPGGLCPAWIINPGTGTSGTWAIHIHGIGTTRLTALRSVPVAYHLGMTSMIPSFRGDGDGPTVPGGSSSLGVTEWHDVEAAIEVAVRNEARNIVLFAWSMGATIAFELAAHSTHRTMIRGIVAIAPVTDWRGVIRSGAKRAGMPALLGTLTAWGLDRAFIQRTLRIGPRINLEVLRHDADETAERMPILIIHSRRDPRVPCDGSRRFAQEHPALVRLEVFDSVGHAWEYNASPDRFTNVISEWFADHQTPS